MKPNLALSYKAFYFQSLYKSIHSKNVWHFVDPSSPLIQCHVLLEWPPSKTLRGRERACKLAWNRSDQYLAGGTKLPGRGKEMSTIGHLLIKVLTFFEAVLPLRYFFPFLIDFVGSFIVSKNSHTLKTTCKHHFSRH